MIGSPKQEPDFHFDLDLAAGKLALSDLAGNPISYYQREGVYIVSEEAALSNFDIEESYQEFTYVIEL